MANVAGVELCIAAARAGALGSLPCGMLPPDSIRAQVAEVRAQVDAPINLNFFCFQMPAQADDSEWRKVLRAYYVRFGIPEPEAAALRLPFDEAYCDLIEELKPEVVSFHFGLPEEPLLKRVKATGAVVLGCATSPGEAFFLEECGVDAIIAQGWEAGGHSGRFLGGDPREALGLFALLPQVVDSVRVPVIGAGAIADGRGMAAALALGATGVQIGTAYLHCRESFLAEGQKKMLRDRATIMIHANNAENRAPDVIAYFSKPDGTLLSAGDRLVNKPYADFLRRLADQGPAALYDGSTAAKIVSRTRAGPLGGSMTLADLAAYKPVKREPICGKYRLYLLCVPPPPSSGVGLIQLIMLLEQTDIGSRGPTDPQAWFLFAEASRVMSAKADVHDRSSAPC